MPGNAEWSIYITSLEDQLNSGLSTPEASHKTFTKLRKILEGDRDLNPLERIAFDDTIEAILDRLLPPPAPAVSTTVESEQRSVLKRSFDIFCNSNNIPSRESKAEYVDLSEYLKAFHSAILDLASEVMNDGHLGSTSSPRTVDYKNKPFEGPGKPVNLLTENVLYAKENWQTVFSFDSLFTLMPSLFTGAEKATVKEYCDREKGVLEQITVWHNRAMIRRQNKGEAGPDLAFAGIRKIYESETSNELSPMMERLFPKDTLANPLSETETRFKRAVELSMAVWSVMSLPIADRQRLWPHVDPVIKNTFYGPIAADDAQSEFRLKKEFDQLPVYRGEGDKQVRMIEIIIKLLKKSAGISDKQALLAYSIGENFRIGGGMEAFFDAKYGSKVFTAATGYEMTSAPSGNVTVAAAEAEAKVANIGLYVDGAVSKVARPDFVVPFADFMSHGYVPYGVAAQFSYDTSRFTGVNVGHFPDGRANLHQLLAVEGGVDAVDWSTRSTNPDKTVFQLANQAVNFMWQAASRKYAIDPKNSLIDTTKIPFRKTFLLDRENERLRVANLFGWQGGTGEALGTKVINFFAGRPKVDVFETLGTVSESSPLSQDASQRIKNLFKDVRDYWLAAADADVGYPFDAVRIYKFLFSRDDGPDGYVNSKVGGKIESMATESPKSHDWLKNNLTPWLQGYITYDLLLRSLYYILSPDFRSSKHLSGDLSEDQLEEMYNNLNFTTYSEYNVSTLAGTELLNIPMLKWLINQSVLVRDLVPKDSSGKTESEKMFEAGYRLFSDPQASPDMIFNHSDLLLLAREFGMGDGYKVVIEKGQMGYYYNLERNSKKATRQYIIDRLGLLRVVFLQAKH